MAKIAPCISMLSLLLAVATTLFQRPARAEPASVEISVLTMGPGDPTFSKFGHDALVVEERGRPTRVYNFGTFSFRSPTLFRDFLKGRLSYWLSVSRLGETLSEYRAQNRSLLIQELGLPEHAALELAAALADNALPEHRDYLYDHFRDNCSTRVRDALDRATGGRVRAALGASAVMSYREHALTLVADDWPLYLGLDLGLGPLVDQPITEWEEAFLPERLARSLRKVKLGDSTGEMPLVSGERIVFEARREPAREMPPRRAPWLALAGAGLGGALALGARRRSRALRSATGFLLTLVSLVSGLLGVLLLFLWTMTNNDVAHRNANAFLSPALALALVPAGIALLAGRRIRPRFSERVALACLVSSLGGVAFALAVAQDVGRTAALFVPIWLGAWLAVRSPPGAAELAPSREGASPV